MPLFKVWTRNRKKKTFLNVETLEDLIQKGAEKFGMETVDCCVVLESDGTPIEEDEVLNLLNKETLMLMKKSEEWIPEGGVSQSSTPDPSTPTSVASLSPTPSCTTQPEPVPGTSRSQMIDTYNSPDRHAAVETLDLPTFSPLVQSHLDRGDSRPVWNRVIAEAANHYLAYLPAISSSHEYRVIGSKLCKKYPCIARQGVTEWSEFNLCLSQKIRNVKHQMKKKSLSPTASGVQREKRLKLSTNTPSTPVELSDKSNEELLAELKKESCRAKPDDAHIKMLLQATYGERHRWMTSLPCGKVRPVIDKYPCLGYAQWIRNECTLRTAAGKPLEEKLTKLITVVKSLFKEDEGQPEVVQAIQFIEGRTKLDRGKGAKSKSIIDVHDATDDDDMNAFLHTEEKSPLKLVVFSEGSRVKRSAVVGDGVVIDAGEELCASILTLIRSYYAFDLEYPRIYSQLLGVLQVVLFGDVYDQVKSRNWKEFMDFLLPKMTEP